MNKAYAVNLKYDPEPNLTDRFIAKKSRHVYLKW